jgi:spore coat polysaccharide biosynthesis protein SpsF (cytidylyltransferase family)
MSHVAMRGFDFVDNTVIDPREGMDIEVLSRKAWLWLDSHAKGNGYREHCTTYIKEHTNEFTKAGFNIHHHQEPYLSEWLPKHLSIDTAEDYQNVKEIWEKWQDLSNHQK